MLLNMPDDILATLTFEAATALIGRTYRVQGRAAQLTVTRVIRATEHGPRPKELKRDSFSIFFRGPADIPLPQRSRRCDGGACCKRQKENEQRAPEIMANRSHEAPRSFADQLDDWGGSYQTKNRRPFGRRLVSLAGRVAF